MKFIYQARTKKGKMRSGTVEAASRKAALEVLQKENLFVTSLESSESQNLLVKEINVMERIGTKDIVNFSRNLSIMSRSGISLVEALETIAEQEGKRTFREIILGLAQDVRGGSSFSKALTRYPKQFSSFYFSMVKSGETSGSLSDSLSYLADHLEREYDLQQSILGAMVYPALVFTVMIAVVIIMMVFVIPQLVDLLEESGQELPWITKVVIAVSNLVVNYGWILLILIVFGGYMAFRYFKSEQGSKILDDISLKVPLVGSFLKKVYLSLFAENFSTLIAGGVPITKALEITGDVVNNNEYKRIIKIARDEVEKGESISSVFLRFPDIFPPMFCQIVSVGEKTGSLDKNLVHIVGFYRKDVDRSVKSMLSILEPILVVFLGVIVGGIMAAVMLPMYSAMGAV